MSEYKNASRPNIIEVWAPTYKMSPGEKERFVPSDVNAVIRDVIEKMLSKEVFDAATAKDKAVELCNEIRRQVVEMNIPRYKLVLQAVIGANQKQGVFIASRCLWDVETDNHAQYSYTNESLFCTVMVFGLYLE